MFRSRDIAAVLAPKSVDEVRELIQTHTYLHPFSTGRNWGLGSREPAQDGVVAFDLGGLDTVRDLDIAAGWAVVEPGVTQAQLAGLLEGTGRMLNITASSAHTSVIGNALDR